MLRGEDLRFYVGKNEFQLQNFRKFGKKGGNNLPHKFQKLHTCAF